MQSKNKNALPNWKNNAISSAIALALTNALFITPASAVPCPNSITTSQQGCDASGVSPIDISSSGSVNASGSNAIYYLGSLDGSLTNNGTISSSGDPNSYSATGVLIINDLAGTLTNNGLIEANLNTSPGTYFTGTGISVGNTLSGTLTNSGSINSTVTSDVYANANSVYINNLDGDMNNSGSIAATANATSTDGYATASGVFARNGQSGTLTNSGSISATATGAGAYAVNGVYAGNALSGTLTNSGSISATATGDTYAIADGVLAWNYGGYYSGNGPSFDLNNSGSIAATANATSTYGYATASGVFARNGQSGTLTNSGSISATATGAGAYAVNGVYAGNALSGTLTNSGSISATATGDTYAIADGVLAGNYGGYYGGYYGGNGPSFDLNNSGSIAATANATSTYGYATASGVFARNGQSGTLTNSGSIAATANSTSTDGYATANGVFAGNGQSGTLTNSGSISATATGDTYADANGVYVNYLDGELNNTGNIAATANSTSTDGYATTTGVYIGNTLSGALTNSGSISAMATGDTYANATGVEINPYIIGSVGRLTNTGAINATATGSNARAAGVSVEVASVIIAGYPENLPAGTIILDMNNSGNISGTADNAQDGYSIHVDNVNTSPFFPPSVQILPVNVGGAINNLAGGLLSGNIYTGGEVAVNNAGTIAIPAGVQGYINGNYNQSSTGVLSIVATSNSNYGQLDVGGIATLAPSTTINVSALDGTQTLSLNGVLANVLSAGTLNASTVNVTDNSVLFNFTPNVYTGNAGHIDLKVEKGIPLLQSVLNEGNYPAVGAAATLDNLIYNGGGTKPFGAVVNALGKMTTQQQLSNAVDQTLPALTSGVAQMTIFTTNEGDSIIGSRQELVLGLSAGDGLSPDRHVWLKPFGNWTQQDKRQGVTGYNADNFGIAIGGDTNVTSTWNVGIAGIYSHGNVHSNSSVAPQRVDMNTYSAKIYATRKFGESTHLNLQAGGGASTYESSRNITFMGTIADADYNGQQARAKVELEHDIAVAKKTKLTPYVALNYVHVNVDAYNEKGANALNLKVNGDSQDSLVIGGGIKVAQEVTDKLLLTAKAGAGYDTMINTSRLSSSFSGGGAVFSTQGINPAKAVFGGNVSAKYTLNTHSEITAGYDIQARENFIDQAATLNVRIKF